MEFFGAPKKSDGWRQPDMNVIVDGMDPAQRRMLHALMDVGVPGRDRLDFLGG